MYQNGPQTKIKTCTFLTWKEYSVHVRTSVYKVQIPLWLGYRDCIKLLDAQDLLVEHPDVHVHVCKDVC